MQVFFFNYALQADPTQHWQKFVLGFSCEQLHSGIYKMAVQHMFDVIMSQRASLLNVARCFQISTKYSHVFKSSLDVCGNRQGLFYFYGSPESQVRQNKFWQSFFSSFLWTCENAWKKKSFGRCQDEVFILFIYESFGRWWHLACFCTHLSLKRMKCATTPCSK